MTMRLILVFLCIARFAPAQTKRCATVEGDRLLARDFAKSLPVFGNLPPETSIAPAPVPGVRRVFRAGEMALLAKRYDLHPETDEEVCFEWEMRELNREQTLEAMRAVLPFEGLEVALLETSRYLVPPGRLEFRREGLGVPASATERVPVQWRGNVIYGNDHRFTVWARVLVSARIDRVVAAVALKRGEPILAGQIRVESVRGFPAAGDLAQRLDQVVGRVLRRDLPSGAEVRLGQLVAPQDVSRGNLVEIEVRSGAARLALTGKAESSGRSGDMVTIRNLSSNRVFQARVSGKDRVLVDIGSLYGN
jgi:flagella basal body P-ring formation protein FlgA